MRESDTRHRIVDFVRNFIDEKGYAPTMDEIRESLGLRTKSLVEYHLKALKEEGIIRRAPELARAMEVVGVGKRARAVPLLGTIAAGEPIDVPAHGARDIEGVEMVEVPVDMLPKNVDAYALKVKGTSMIDALVADGDIVVLDATPHAENGQMVAAWLLDRQEATLKKFYREPHRIRLQPANESMAPIYVDLDDIKVQGRVIAVLRKYKLYSA